MGRNGLEWMTDEEKETNKKFEEAPHWEADATFPPLF